MSLVNFAVRQCLKRALLGRTMAGERVFDSMVVPLDETQPDGMLPRIIVSTDDDQITSVSTGLDVASRELDVIVEMELSAEVELEAGNVTLAIPPTDAGLEASLDFLHRQILRALAEPGAPWADLYRELTGTQRKVLKRRGASNEKGVRFAARQLVFTYEPVNEPAYGREPNRLWSAVIAAMRADPELSEYGDLLAQEITGEALPSWAVLQARMGWTDAQTRLLGPAPLDPAEVGEAPTVVATDLDTLDRSGRLVDTLTIADGQTASFEPVGR